MDCCAILSEQDCTGTVRAIDLNPEEVCDKIYKHETWPGGFYCKEGDGDPKVWACPSVEEICCIPLHRFKDNCLCIPCKMNECHALLGITSTIQRSKVITSGIPKLQNSTTTEFHVGTASSTFGLPTSYNQTTKPGVGRTTLAYGLPTSHQNSNYPEMTTSGVSGMLDPRITVSLCVVIPAALFVILFTLFWYKKGCITPRHSVTVERNCNSHTYQICNDQDHLSENIAMESSEHNDHTTGRSDSKGENGAICNGSQGKYTRKGYMKEGSVEITTIECFDNQNGNDFPT